MNTRRLDIHSNLLAVLLASACSSTAAGGSGADDGASGASGDDGATAVTGGVDDAGTGTAGLGGTDDDGTTAADTTGVDATTGSGSDGASDSGGEPMPSAPDCAIEACTGDWLWAHRWGEEDGSGVVQTTFLSTTDPAGNTTLAFRSYGATDLGAAGTIANSGYYVARIDPDGDAVWVSSIDGYNITRMVARGDSVFVLADGAGLYPRLLEIDALGNIEVPWAMAQPGGEVSAHDLAFADNGDIAIVGHLRGTADFGGDVLTTDDYGDAFVVVLAGDYGHLWSRRFGADGTQDATGVGFSSDGDLTVTGLNRGTIGFGASVFVAGPSLPWVARLEREAGEEVWSRQFDASFDSPTMRLFPLDDGFLLASRGTAYPVAIDFGNGSVEGPVQVARLDDLGDVMWARAYGSKQGIADYVRDDATGLIMVGYISEATDFSDGVSVVPYGTQGDAFIAKLHVADGNITWTRLVGDDDLHDYRQEARGVGVDAAGNVYVSGDFRGTFDVGFGDVTSSGGMPVPDLFLAKLSP